MSTQTAAPPTEPDLVDLIVDFLASKEPALAERRQDITADLRAEFGGQRWYVSARPETERQQRVRKILEMFNGRNATEVARRLRISRATVYRVIKQPGPPAERYPQPAIGVSSVKAPKAPKDAAKRPADQRPAPASAEIPQIAPSRGESAVSPLPIAETPNPVRSSDGVFTD